MGVAVLQRGAVTALDYRCDVLPGDRPFPEVHASMSVSYVRSGSFGYRARGRSYELVAGSLLIGNAGDEFTCTHDFVHGDECLSFHLAPDIAEEIAGGAFWKSGVLAPAAATGVLGELAQAAAEGQSHVAIDEAALMLGHRAASMVDGAHAFRTSDRDRKRAVEAAEWIEATCEQQRSLSSAAAAANLSPFHFLRVFTRVVGVTPHQYLVRSRLRRAARLLARSAKPVTEVAIECGFGDLANFTRTFGRAAGRSPGAFRNFRKA